jgi:HK97 gp10 family phage protein
MEQSATEIVAMMKNLVAVDDGDLRDSIGWTWGKAPKGALTIATITGAGSASDLLLTIYAGNEKAYYARWVEFGTASSSAQPFFYVSYRALKKRTKSRITRATNKAAKQVAAGG